MDNLLDSLINEAGESLLQLKVSKTLPTLPDPEKQGEIMKENGYSDEIISEYKNTVNNTSTQLDDMVKNAALNNPQGLEEIKSDLKDLGTSCGLLVVGTAGFLTRVASVAPAIISVTPLGPGVSPQLILPMIKDLKAEGDNLSKVYDDCDSKMSKLGLEDIEGTMSRVKGKNKSLINLEPITGVISIVKSAMNTAKPLILAVGANVGGEEGSLPEVEPPITIEYYATDCVNFSYIFPPNIETGEDDISAGNCSKFEPWSEDNTERKCNNCKHYKKKS